MYGDMFISTMLGAGQPKVFIMDSELRCNVCGKSIQYGDTFYENGSYPLCNLECATDFRDRHGDEIWNGEEMQHTVDPWYRDAYRREWNKLCDRNS